jgi:alanine racemase
MGITKPIAILGHTPSEELRHVDSNDYRQVISRLDVAKALSDEARTAGKPARIHLKIETGTNRQGVLVEDLRIFVEELRRFPALDIEGVYTHYANIEDTLDPSFAQSQLQRFREALGILESLGVRPPVIHTAATSGVLLYPETDFSMVRLGIGAYGVWPSRETQLAARERGRQISLSPILTWKTRVAQVKSVRAGEYVGYGLTYRAGRPMQVVVVPVGYYDGYDRRLSNSGRALIQGQPVPVIGRVAMNMMMLDVTDVGAQQDDEVVLLGRQQTNEIRVEEMAEKAGTIPYEILCRINPLIPRLDYARR